MSPPHSSLRPVRLVFCSTILAISLLGALYHLPDRPATALLIAAACVLLAWLLVRAAPRIGIRTELFLSLSVTLLLLAGPEYVLRHLGFIYVSGATFHLSEDKSFAQFSPHPDLLWTLDPRTEGINSFGFPGKEIVLSKQERTFRVLFLGDSCVQQGHPKMVQRRLNRKFQQHGKTFESISLAVAGYSTAQGVATARKYAPLLNADLAVIQFGWNDHWRYTTAKDSVLLKNSKALSSTEQWLQLLYEKSRVLQFSRFVLEELRAAEHPLSNEVRVPLAEYRENLREMQEVFAEYQVPIMLVTAPTAHYVRGVPWYLKKLRHIENEDEAIQLHQDYSAATRAFSRNRGVPLVDLEQDLSTLPAPVLKELFSSDGIHYRTKGVQEVARRIAEAIEESFLPDKSQRATPPKG